MERVVERTEYVNVLKYDSIYLHQTDTVYVVRQGDTVRINSIKTVFKDHLKIQRDTVLRTDTVIIRQHLGEKEAAPPTPERNRNSGRGLFWWFGLMVFVAGLVYVLFKILKILKIFDISIFKIK